MSVFSRFFKRWVDAKKGLDLLENVRDAPTLSLGRTPTAGNLKINSINGIYVQVIRHRKNSRFY
jgi:hypothetical protein